MVSLLKLKPPSRPSKEDGKEEDEEGDRYWLVLNLTISATLGQKSATCRSCEQRRENTMFSVALLEQLRSAAHLFRGRTESLSEQIERGLQAMRVLICMHLAYLSRSLNDLKRENERF